MAQWKKVITSGSQAELNTLATTAGKREWYDGSASALDHTIDISGLNETAVSVTVFENATVEGDATALSVVIPDAIEIFLDPNNSNKRSVKVSFSTSQSCWVKIVG